MKVLLLLGIALLACPAQGQTLESPHAGNSCGTRSSSWVVQQGHPDFTRIAGDLDAFFSTARSNGVLATPSHAALVGQGSEFIRIEADTGFCLDEDSRAGIASIGGCDYIGCTGNLPEEFQVMPPGSQVTLASCGAGIRTTGTFVKQSNGLWMMTAYQTQQVSGCDPAA